MRINGIAAIDVVVNIWTDESLTFRPGWRNGFFLDKMKADLDNVKGISGTKVPDDLVYKVTKLMNEHAKDFHGLFPGSEEIQSKTALEYNKLPIHPGAERYYREIGLMR